MEKAAATQKLLLLPLDIYWQKRKIPLPDASRRPHFLRKNRYAHSCNNHKKHHGTQMKIAIFRTEHTAYNYTDAVVSQVTDWYEATDKERSLLSQWLSSLYPTHVLVEQLGKNEVADTIAECIKIATAHDEAQRAREAAAEVARRKKMAAQAARRAKKQAAFFQDLRNKYEKTVDVIA